jgi:DNA-binding NtrC family response regulator
MTVRVLVVDDEPDVEVLFRSWTSSMAASVSRSYCWSPTSTCLGMSGIDLIPEVKARRPDLPVFMISAYGDTERVKTALERGASKCVTKPVDFPLLKQDVSRVVAHARGSE